MQRIQHDTVNPALFTDIELARYSSLYGADELPKPWVAELLKRFLKLVDAKQDASHE